jgi:hypothetical protein
LKGAKEMIDEKFIAELEKLSITDMINGILVYAGDYKFTERKLNEFFYSLGEKNEIIADRLCFKGARGQLYSEPLRRILSFLEMGKSVEISPPNPVDQYYRPRLSQLESIGKYMNSVGVLPMYEAQLKKLAHEFREAKP